MRSFRHAFVDCACADGLRHIPVGRCELEEGVGGVGIVDRRHLPIGAIEVDCHIMLRLAGELQPIPHVVAFDDADRRDRVLAQRIAGNRDSSSVVVGDRRRHLGDRQRGRVHRIVDRAGNRVGDPAAVGPLVDVVVHGSHRNRPSCRVIEGEGERGGERRAAVGADLGLGIGCHRDLDGAGRDRGQSDLVGVGRTALGQLRAARRLRNQHAAQVVVDDLDSEQVLAHDRFQEIAQIKKGMDELGLVRPLPQCVVDGGQPDRLGLAPISGGEQPDVLELVSHRVVGVDDCSLARRLFDEHPHLVRGRFGELYPVGRLLPIGDLDRSDRLLACLIGRHLHHAAIVEDADGDVSHRHVVVVRIGAGHRVPDLPGLRSLDQAVVDGRDGDCPRRPVVEREDEGRSECRPPVGADQGAGVGRDRDLDRREWHRLQRERVRVGRHSLEDLRGTSRLLEPDSRPGHDDLVDRWIQVEVDRARLLRH